MTALTRVAIAAFVALVPASSWAQTADGIMGAAIDDVLRRGALIVGTGLGFVLLMIGSSTERRETLGLTILLGLVVSVGATVIAVHYGSWLTATKGATVKFYADAISFDN